MQYIEKTLTGVIESGQSSITFTDDFITDDSIIDVFFSDDDINPTEQTQTGNRVVIDILPLDHNISIAVRVTNADVIDYNSEIENINGTLTVLNAKVNGLNASNINYDEHSTLYSAIGDIDTLESESKNLVGAINENFTSVSNGKSLIASAITDKGVETLATDTFQTMANNIGQIQGGGGDISTMSVVASSSGYVTSVTTTANYDGYMLVQFYYPNSGWDNTVRSVKEDGINISFVSDRFTTFGGSAIAQAVFKCKQGSTYVFTCNRTSNYAIHKLGVS